MITLLEVLAMLTLAGIGVAFFRRRIRRGSALALMFAGFCMTFALAPGAAASETRKGQSASVSSEETIKGDIFLFGDRVKVDGTVEGDVYLFGHDATVHGHVQGDVIGFAQTLQVDGKVDGNIRAFTNTLTIRGTVAKNVLTFDERVNLESSGKIGGSLTIFVESLSLEGSLGRDLLAFGKRVTISGKIGGDVRDKGSELTITAGGEVGGRIRYEGDNPAEVSPQAKLASPVEYKKLEHKREYRDAHYYIWRVIWTAAFVLFGMVLFLLAPGFAKETITAAERYGAPIGLGILVFFGVPIAALIACFTVVGIPLGLFTVGFWLLMLCCAELVVGAVVGIWILGRATDTWGMIGRMTLGFVIVRIIYTPLAQIHVVGLLVGLGILMWGMGAISLALYRKFEPVISPSMPSAPTASPLPPNTTVGGVQPA